MPATGYSYNAHGQGLDINLVRKKGIPQAYNTRAVPAKAFRRGRSQTQKEERKGPEALRTLSCTGWEDILPQD